MSKKSYIITGVLFYLLMIILTHKLMYGLSFHMCMSLTGIWTVSFVPGIFAFDENHSERAELYISPILATAVYNCYITYFDTYKVVDYTLKIFGLLAGIYLIGVLAVNLKYRNQNHSFDFAVVYSVLSVIFSVCYVIGFGAFTVKTHNYDKINNMKTAPDHTRVSVLSAFSEDNWEDMNVESRLLSLRNIAEYEKENLGLPFELTVMIEYNQQPDVMAYYSPGKKTVFFNASVVENESAETNISVLCHEAYHRAQFSYMDAYEKIPEEYKDLPFFQKAKTFIREINTYETKDFERYKNQQLEITSRVYSECRTESYINEIIELDIYGRSN